MAKNEFKSFATATTANVTPQADWEKLPALLNGFTAGKASSAQINKAIRQSSFITSSLAQYIANNTSEDVLDNGDSAGFIVKITKALSADFQKKGDYATKDDLSKKLDTTQVSQSTGASQTAVMSQKAVTDELNKRVSNTRKINNKELSSDIDLTAEDVGALAKDGTAAAAKKLEHKLTISGQDFDGSRDVSINISAGLGFGQGYHLLTQSRAFGVTYKSPVDEAIGVAVTQNGGQSVTMQAYVNNEMVFNVLSNSGTNRPNVFFVVPADTEYRVVGAGASVFVWSEMRR